MNYAYASRTGNVESIVNTLGLDAVRINDGSETMDGDFILFTLSFAGIYNTLIAISLISPYL